MQQKVLNNRYELEQKIGEGGMARVYRGRDLRLNRRVAVKVLHSHFAGDNSFLRRFHHEAQAAANLHHPNIVDVYDVGQDRDIHYIVMEYVPGSDLKSLILQSGSLPVEQAVSIAAAVAEGLEAAHRLGMVHRDIKPQNIIVSPDGQVKITDFGIAKSAYSTAMTETGVTFGTADYISPEQARGQQATPQSDIYSLGVSLYEALTGRLPFTGDSSIAVAMQHVSDAPPPPHIYNPRVPPQIEALIMRAMSKDASARPATAREFGRALMAQLALSEQATVVRPAGPHAAATLPHHGPAFAQGAHQPAASSVTAPRVSLPPPRPPVMAQAPASSGPGFGTFLLGLLLLGVILGGVYLFVSGALDGILTAGSGAVQRPPIGLGSTPAPTATAEGAPTPTATPGPSPTPLPVMPNLIGLERQEAIDLLLEQGLIAREEAPRHSDIISGGLVLDQYPRLGEQISETTTITYVLSLGPEVVEIPDVIGVRAANAQFVLEQAGFRVQVTEEPSTSVSAGFVIRTEPSPGLRPPRGEVVTLVVSIGNRTTMPDVTGLPVEEARRLIEAAGLFVSFEDLQGCDRLPQDVCANSLPGEVVSSVPRGGSQVERGTGVTLGVRAP